MGICKSISYDSFPEQNVHTVGKRVEVCYNHDSSQIHMGTVVRDDTEPPFETLIKCDNGRYLRSVECSYRIKE